MAEQPKERWELGKGKGLSFPKIQLCGVVGPAQLQGPIAPRTLHHRNTDLNSIFTMERERFTERRVDRTADPDQVAVPQPASNSGSGL